VGLTGRQGVIIPRSNVENLTLREDVRSAVADGRFHLWAIEHIEEGWPILARREAGRIGDDGFPEGSVYGAVADRLEAWASRWKELQGSGTNGNGNGTEAGVLEGGP